MSVEIFLSKIDRLETIIFFNQLINNTSHFRQDYI